MDPLSDNEFKKYSLPEDDDDMAQIKSSVKFNLKMGKLILFANTYNIRNKQFEGIWESIKKADKRSRPYSEKLFKSKDRKAFVQQLNSSEDYSLALIDKTARMIKETMKNIQSEDPTLDVEPASAPLMTSYNTSIRFENRDGYTMDIYSSNDPYFRGKILQPYMLNKSQTFDSESQLVDQKIAGGGRYLMIPNTEVESSKYFRTNLAIASTLMALTLMGLSL